MRIFPSPKNRIMRGPGVLLKYVYANSQYFCRQNWFFVKLRKWKKFWFDFIKILTPLWFFSNLNPISTNKRCITAKNKKKSRESYIVIYTNLLTTYFCSFWLLIVGINSHFLTYNTCVITIFYVTYCHFNWGNLVKHSRIMQSFQNLQPVYCSIRTILHKVDLD